ncbi:hypothetical protein [Thermodesulfitimonas sp.]
MKRKKQDKKVVFDSYALLALVGDEAGADTVARIIADEDTTVYLSVISLGKVYYAPVRR